MLHIYEHMQLHTHTHKEYIHIYNNISEREQVTGVRAREGMKEGEEVQETMQLCFV